MIYLHSHSQAGGHLINEDAFVAAPHPADPDCWLICLADGQGGRAGGARAARLACETAAAIATEHSPSDLTKPSLWQTILTRADAMVCDESSAGFSTLIGLCVRNDRLVGASSGDSAAVVIGQGTTHEVTAHQHKNPPVGSGVATFVPFMAKLVRPWRLLVMSDGVWKYAGWAKINETASQIGGPELLVELQDAARLRGTGAFPDDFTVVLLEAPA